MLTATATTDTYTLSLHDALPISWRGTAAPEAHEARSLPRCRGCGRSPVLRRLLPGPGRCGGCGAWKRRVQRRTEGHNVDTGALRAALSYGRAWLRHRW